MTALQALGEGILYLAVVGLTFSASIAVWSLVKRIHLHFTRQADQWTIQPRQWEDTTWHDDTWH